MINTYPSVTKVTQVAQQEISLELWIDPNCDYFKGHFDQQPIFPGLGQIDFAIKMANQYLGLDMLACRDIPQIKFMRIIAPNDQVILSLKYANGVLSFYYAHGEKVASQGKIKYVG